MPLAILRLCRVYYLPTVWSNCLAGWWLSGGGYSERVPWLLAAVSLLQLGAVFLNDALDADYDQQHHPHKPIPSGRISRKSVWRAALVCLILGSLVLLTQGPLTGSLALVLVVCLVLFNALHRFHPGAAFFLGFGRLLLYLMGGSIALRGVSGWTIWCGLALAGYATGVAYFRGYQDKPERAKIWPAVLLFLPIVLALIMNAGSFREAALLLGAVFGLWIIRSLRQSLWSVEKDFGGTAAGLTAGMVFADWLAVANAPRELSFIFISLFLAVVALQSVTTRQTAT